MNHTWLPQLMTFTAGLLAGIGLYKYSTDIRVHFQAPLPPDGLEAIADELMASSKKLAGLSKIMQELADGAELEQIEADMPPELKQGWDEWKTNHHIK